MAKADTTSITIRLADELVKWADSQPGTRTAVIEAALTNLRDGPVIVDNADAARVARLEAQIADLTAEVGRLRALSNRTTVDAVATKRIPVGQHAAGPVLQPTGLRVSGVVTPRFRPGTNADKATRSG